MQSLLAAEEGQGQEDQRIRIFISAGSVPVFAFRDQRRHGLSRAPARERIGVPPEVCSGLYGFLLQQGPGSGPGLCRGEI